MAIRDLCTIFVEPHDIAANKDKAMGKELTNIDALTYDAHNFNRHTPEGRELLKKSITENGFGRSIVVDKDNNIIAGNGIVEAARATNKKRIKIIDTTGDELVVVRRTDIDIDTEEGRRMALADNATAAANLSWDYDALEEARERWNVTPEDWGVTIESEEYRQFVEKFDKTAEKTTDDCYTPQDVYEKIRDYFIGEGIIPEGAKIVRPFYPGGDYEREEYPDGCVVYDNPPFSILTKITKFYKENGVKFLLFAPSLTSLSFAKHFTVIDAGVEIIYDNGAVVRTSFVSNCYPDDYAIVSPGYELSDEIKELPSQQVDSKKKYSIYEYPDNVVQIARVRRICEAGYPFVWLRSQMQPIGYLQNMRNIGKEAFGQIFLQSDAQERAQKLAQERAQKLAQERAQKAIVIELTDSEREIINQLNQQSYVRQDNE